MAARNSSSDIFCVRLIGLCVGLIGVVLRQPGPLLDLGPLMALAMRLAPPETVRATAAQTEQRPVPIPADVIARQAIVVVVVLAAVAVALGRHIPAARFSQLLEALE